jgi:hypothetical protein
MPGPLTNIRASQALRGEVITVTLDPSTDGYPDSGWLNNLVTVDSSGKKGIVSNIDRFGVTFQVTPIQPDRRFDTDSTPGILSAGEQIIFD